MSGYVYDNRQLRQSNIVNVQQSAPTNLGFMQSANPIIKTEKHLIIYVTAAQVEWRGNWEFKTLQELPMLSVVTLNCQLSWIQVFNCQNFKIVKNCQNWPKLSNNCQNCLRSCFLITLIKCIKGHKSCYLFRSPKVGQWVKRSPIELYYHLNHVPAILKYLDRVAT